MPPIRSLSATKPVKTERTHEENQERYGALLGYPLCHSHRLTDAILRAYIAASRRSDRSLEARIESARRASEIHKRRTGRSLRVTEADVVNEEMYEEEDDDLPMQYRRLTAHLNGNASDFNRRLAAYLTNQVAMRDALDQAISKSYAPSGQQWDPATQTLQPLQPQWMASPTNIAQQQHLGPMGPPNGGQRSPTNHRQTPYPANAGNSYRSDASHRPSPIVTANRQMKASVTSQPGLPSPAESCNGDEPRHVNVSYPKSAPPLDVGPLASGALFQRRANSDASVGQLRDVSQPLNNHNSSNPISPETTNNKPAPIMSDNLALSTQTTPWSAPPQTTSFSPMQQFNGLSTALPNEAQMFFSPGFTINDFNGRPSMKHEKPNQQPFYSYNPNGFNRSRFEGMNQTLAPSAFEQGTTTSSTSAATDFQPNFFAPSLNQDFDPIFGEETSPQMFMPSEGANTPDHDFSTFINSNAWEETTT